MKEEIKRVSFYIWEGQRLKHMEEIVKIKNRESMFDKLKDKYETKKVIIVISK